MDLASHNTTRVTLVEKDNQELKEENHRLEGAKKIAQAVRSRVLENYKKHHSIFTGVIPPYGLVILQLTGAHRAKTGTYIRTQSGTILNGY